MNRSTNTRPTRPARRIQRLGAVFLVVIGTMAIGIPNAFAHHPDVAASVDCEGVVTFTSTAWAGQADDPNTAQDENELSRTNPSVGISYSVDGGAFTSLPQQATFSYSKANGYTFGGTFTLAQPLPAGVIVRATTLAPWANGAAAGDSRESGTLTVPACPEGPSASIADAECATQSVSVTLTNSGNVPVDFTVSKDGTPLEVVTVGADQSVVKTYPLSGDVATIKVTAPGMNPVEKVVQLVCITPEVSFSVGCSEDGVAIEFINPGPAPTTFTVNRDGATIDTVTVAAGESLTRSYVVHEDQSATFEVSAPGMDSKSRTVLRDCFDAEADARVACFQGGALVTMVNDGNLETVFTVTKDGRQIDTVSVDPGNDASRVYEMAEGESAVFRVSADGFQSGPMSLTYECTEVLGEQFENPPVSPPVTQAAASSDLQADGAQLPVTGADPKFLLVLALSLILFGGFALAFSNRRGRVN